MTRDDLAEHLPHEVRRTIELTVAVDRKRNNCVWNLHLEQMRERLVDRVKIHLHDVATFLAIHLAN